MSPNQPSVLRRPTSDIRLSSRFVPKIAEIETLGTSTEQRGQNFAKFLKSIHHHALTTFNKAILNFTDPLTELQKDTLSLLSAIRKKNNLNPLPPLAKESESEQFVRETENTDCRDKVKVLYSTR